MKLKLAPGKVAVKKVEAKLKGGLELPQSYRRSFDLGEVVEVGRLDSFGFEGKDKTVENYKHGDLVLFQLPLVAANMTTHKVKDTLILFLNAADIVARLDSNVIELKSFHIAGRFVLLRPTLRKESVIIVPDSATEARKESLHFSVMQKGADVNINIFTGQEVFPNRGRMTTIFVDNEEVCFTDQAAIDGCMVEESEKLPPPPPPGPPNPPKPPTNREVG